MKKNYLSPELILVLVKDDVMSTSPVLVENDDLGESPEWF